MEILKPKKNKSATLHYWSNRETVLEKRRIYRIENPEKIRSLATRMKARRRGAKGSHTLDEWNAILKSHNNQCAICGISKKTRPLTRDHIIPISKGGSDFAFNIQPLCLSCNCKKKAKLASGAQHSLFDRLG
jgi:5-methylcytosine-specific restriction endonuclease McrA